MGLSVGVCYVGTSCIAINRRYNVQYSDLKSCRSDQLG